MASYKDFYQTESKHLKAEDIKGREFTLAISKWGSDEFGENDGTKKRKMVIFFEGGEKGLALNKTNAERIADAYGEDPDYWVGKSVILYVERVSFGNEMVDGLRVRIPAQPATGFPGQSSPVQQGIAAQAPLPGQNGMNGPEHAPAVSDFPGDR